MSPQPKLALIVGLLLPLAGAGLLVVAAFVPWLRVQSGARDALSSYNPGDLIASPHLTSLSLDGLPFWLTLAYTALLAGLAVAGLRAAATGWDTPTLPAKRLLLVSGLAVLLMVHELFSFVADLLGVDSLAGSSRFSDRFNPGLGLLLGPLGALLALAGALLAVEWSRRAERAGAWLPLADAPAPFMPACVHSMLPAGAGDVARLLLDRWRAVLTLPARASFEPELPGAGWIGAIANVAALVGVQVLVSLLCGTLSFAELATDIVMTPVAFFLLAGALLLVARVLGGEGSLAAHMHLVALAWAPAAALSSVAFAVGAPFVSGLAGVVLGGYGVFLAVIATLTVHGIGGRQTAPPASLPAPIVTGASPSPSQPIPPQAALAQLSMPAQVATPLPAAAPESGKV